MKRPAATTTFLLAALAVTLAVAFIVSPFASSSPDGLERVAIDEGFADEATEHDLADGPLADYAIGGRDSRWSTGVSGIIGVAITLAVTAGGLQLLRRTRPAQERPVEPSTTG